MGRVLQVKPKAQKPKQATKTARKKRGAYGIMAQTPQAD